MFQQDRQKLLDAGYRIMRIDEQQCKIKETTVAWGNWKTYMVFGTKKALINEKWRILREEPKMIFD